MKPAAGVRLSGRVLLGLTLCASGGFPLLAAQNDIQVDLTVPSPLLQGQIYEAQLEVESPVAIPDAYVKLALPYAFKVLSGETHFRGTLSAVSPLFVRARFTVTGIPTAPISGKILAYNKSGQAAFGRGKILYCKAVGRAVILSEKNPDAEADLAVERRLLGSSLSSTEAEVLRARRRRTLDERAVLIGTLRGSYYAGALPPACKYRKTPQPRATCREAASFTNSKAIAGIASG